MTQDWIPESKVAKTVYAVGFQYDTEQDIIFSRMDAWQREFGYAYAYDLAAPATISAVIDCEPIFFRYDDKDWMIELWKGHYGLETGGEIGVYVRSRQWPVLDATIGHRPHDPANAKFFECANDSERLEMSFTLNRDGTPLFRRGPEKHWWLTGFKWGVLSTPEQLTMDVEIVFPTAKMGKAFVAALEKSGYQDIHLSVRSVRFTFAKPVSVQPRLDPNCQLLVESARENNAVLVKNYQKLNLENNDPNHIPDEFADYFNAYGKDGMRGPLEEVLMSRDIDSAQVKKGLEELFGRQQLWKKIVDFFKELFNR